MENQDNVERDYRLKRKKMEAQQDDVMHKRNKGISVLEEVQARSQYYLKDYVLDESVLAEGAQQIEQMKSEVIEDTTAELQRLDMEIAELDKQYWKKVIALREKE